MKLEHVWWVFVILTGALVFMPWSLYRDHVRAQAAPSFEQQCSTPNHRLMERQTAAQERIATALEKIERKMK